MTAVMSFEDLGSSVEDGSVDTVLACIIDMQGRLMGKRFHAEHFLVSAWKESHCCNYLLATDLEMTTPEGFRATSWEKGYGDYMMRPDMTTLRPVPWLEKTVMVLCDVLDHHGHTEIAHSPRAMLKRQIARTAALGFDPMMATELEFFLFANSGDDIRLSGYRDLAAISAYNDDYNILHTTRAEPVMRPIRNHLFAAGIPVENTKGEAETGQQELNIRYATGLATADYHTIAKHAIKEIAWQQGHGVTFMPKWHRKKVGSSSHVHLSLWQGGENAFYDPDGQFGMSELMRRFMAGMIRHAPDYTVFLAPYINSYKRFQKGTFAPTRMVWSVDNRTAAFRLCGEGTSAVRVECRIGGSDLNPYLAMAAMLAAGLKGVEDRLELQPPSQGDAYKGKTGSIPANLRDARTALLGSSMLREAFGDEVVEHYARAAEVELDDFDLVVTDYELARGFERA
ncbi:MAG: glutamine synthetase [Rhodobacteraceae bacterium]|nr:glutamine synthetase [Paracoccaceae bacterium]